MNAPVIRKAMAYVTNGNRLLVFRQPDSPDAGIQIPGGSMEPGEQPDDEVLREAIEETGLPGLTIRSCLGVVEHDLTPSGEAGLLQRHYYHLTVAGDLPDTWQHMELDPSDGDESVLFEFFWVPLPDGVPPMVGMRDEMIPALLRSLGYE